jgi:hypothetical protein
LQDESLRDLCRTPSDSSCANRTNLKGSSLVLRILHSQFRHEEEQPGFLSPNGS